MNRMRKHSDHDVASLAKDVYMEWRTFIKHHSNRPSIEVKSDPKTEAFRKNARKLLCEALDLEVVFMEHVRQAIVGHSYPKTSPSCKVGTKVPVFSDVSPRLSVALC